MLVTELYRFRDGGTIAICIDNQLNPTYHCNPGVFGSKACIGRFKQGSGYNPPPIPQEEMQQLKVALTLYRTADKYKQDMVNQVLGVMHEVYGIEL